MLRWYIVEGSEIVNICTVLGFEFASLPRLKSNLRLIHLQVPKNLIHMCFSSVKVDAFSREMHQNGAIE